MGIRYEKISNGIINCNLTVTDEPGSENRGGDSLGGFTSECYLGQRRSPRIEHVSNQCYAHFRERALSV